jgi:hypothetical protein
LLEEYKKKNNHFPESSIETLPLVGENILAASLYAWSPNKWKM